MLMCYAHNSMHIMYIVYIHTHVHMYVLLDSDAPLRGPYATAMGRCWHPEHFVCHSCQKQLQNTMFVFEEESIYCEKCYEKTFAKTCHSCHRPIVGVSHIVTRCKVQIKSKLV